MDIAELLAETEELKKRTIETAQQLAEAKKLLARYESIIYHYGAGNYPSDQPDKVYFANGFGNEILCLLGNVKEFLQ